jgi:hypothetical protein
MEKAPALMSTLLRRSTRLSALSLPPEPDAWHFYMHDGLCKKSIYSTV